MLLSNTIESLHGIVGDGEAIKLYAEAGFDAFDMSFTHMAGEKDCPMNGSGYLDYAKKLREIAENAGIVCNQAHAPFFSDFGSGKNDDEYMKMILRSAEAAAVLGAEYIIVHPAQYLPYADNRALLREKNIRIYSALAEYGERLGICFAAENMWQVRDGYIVGSTCASPDEFCDYIDTVNSERVGACLDIGHVCLTGETIRNTVRTLGCRLKALHVHDNDLLHDSHTLPFLMKIDFSELTGALSDIHYKGDFTFEVIAFDINMPLEMRLPAAKLVCAAGRYLIKQIKA